MRTVAIAVAALCLTSSATVVAQAPNCRAISDSLERLRCYDAHYGAGPAKPPKTTSAEDSLITAAKAKVRDQLREPASAAFADIKIKTDTGGTKGVCGTVNSRNAMGGMTGPKLFVFNGKVARILVSSEGAENGTTLDRILLGVVLGETLKLHDQFCKS